MVHNGNAFKMDNLGVPLFQETSRWRRQVPNKSGRPYPWPSWSSRCSPPHLPDVIIGKMYYPIWLHSQHNVTSIALRGLPLKKTARRRHGVPGGGCTTHTHKIQDVDQHIIDHIQMCTHKMVVAHSRQASVQRCLSPQMLSWVNGSLITLS